MSDQSATPSGVNIFREMTTVEMKQSGGGAAALPARFAELLQPPQRPGDLGVYNGWPVVRLLGRGGMGLVLQSYDQRLRRDVAIKTIHPDLLDDVQMAARFAREARVTAQINHPNVITIYSVHDESGQAFIVMELLQGGTLQDRLREQRAGEQECVHVARDIAEGLHAAHELGLLHRDLKPSNIGFRRQGKQAVIMDFGLARTVCDTDPLTLHGSPMGTPAFMSPEQVQVKKLDCRSDLYSLGTVMFLMASGELPFHGSSPAIICNSITTAPTPSLRNLVPGISPDLEAIIVRLLQKNPAQRFQTASEVIDALNRVAMPAVPRRKSLLSVGAVVAGLLGAGVGGWYWNANRSAPPATEPQLAVAAINPDASSSDVAPASIPAAPAVPELRDLNGVVWRSTNREHAGQLGIEEDTVRLEQTGTDRDNWAMAEAALDGPSAGPRYLLLEIKGLTGPGDVQWAVKLAPRKGSDRDVELAYSSEAGRFAIPLPEPAGTDSTSEQVRLFVVGPDGASVSLSNVRIEAAIPSEFQELSALWSN